MNKSSCDKLGPNHVPEKPDGTFAKHQPHEADDACAGPGRGRCVHQLSQAPDRDDFQQSTRIHQSHLSGAFFRLINRPKLFTPELAVAAFSALVAVEHFYPAHLWAVTWIIIPYLCVAFGQGSLPVVRRFGRFGDPSYGMYLYAFPVQQTLQFMSGNTMSAPNMIAATTGISVLLGYASWHAVEKHVLDLIKTRSVQPSPDRVREELARQDGEAKAEDHARAVS